jgi:hypothetical protein
LLVLTLRSAASRRGIANKEAIEPPLHGPGTELVQYVDAGAA